ncbi:MAG: hypothetical protein ACN4GZ_06600 [Acidimicrobiales bacterium]
MLKRLLFIGAAIAMVVGLTGPVGAGPKDTDRAFNAHLTGELTFAFGEPCDQGPIVTTTSYGNATHMGRVEAHWTQCAIGATGGFVDQTGTIVSHKGDAIMLAASNPAGQNPYPVTIVGGTGRFEGATGSVMVSFQVVPELLPHEQCTPSPQDPCFNPFVPWAWSARIDGRISY